MNDKKLLPKVVILCPKGDIEHVERLKLPYEITSYMPKNVEESDTTLVLRWGAGWKPRSLFDEETEFRNIITDWRSIRFNCCKNESSQKLSEIVRAPKVYTKRVNTKGWVVVRPLQHARGEDFKVVKGPFKLKEGFYAKQFIMTDKEARIWVCDGKTMAARRVTQSVKRLSQKFKCRSKWGYAHWKKTPRGLHRQALKAARALGFKYGAFDVIYNKRNKKWYFLEFNSACAIDDKKIINFFRSGFKRMVNKKIKQIRKDWRKNPPLELKFEVVPLHKLMPNYNPYQLDNIYQPIIVEKPATEHVISQTKPIAKPSFMSRLINFPKFGWDFLQA